ncbi:MAG: sulfurtransferase TusA [Pseudomonadota bacterium]
MTHSNASDGGEPAQAQERELDARGLYCPEPVMLLHRAVRDMAEGELLRIVATDPSTERDVPKFCEFLGHRLVSAQQIDREFHYVICKQ